MGVCCRVGDRQLPDGDQQRPARVGAGHLDRLHVLQYDGLHPLHALHGDDVGLARREARVLRRERRVALDSSQ